MSFHRISGALLALLAGMSGLAHAAPLSFNAALDIAERQSPNLASNRAQIAAAQSSAIPAGALPDPKIFAGIDNYPVSGPDRGRLNSDSMTMQKIGVMQDFPNAAKRQARVAVAEASIETAQAQRQVERLKLRRATALAWLKRYFLERKISLFDDLDKENLLLADAVRAQIASGRTQVADSVMPKQEAAQLADRRDELIRDLVKAKSGLRRYVGGEADEPLVDALPDLRIDGDHLRGHLHKHPELQAFSAESHKAEVTGLKQLVQT
jgi:cobalt-zinc-cadmium efflux system outer membrane protein